MYDDFPSRVPWNWQPYLSEMCSEVNVDYDKFIEGLAENKSDRKSPICLTRKNRLLNT